MEYDQAYAGKRVLLTCQFGEGLSEEVTSELRPDIRKSQCEVSGRRPIQTNGRGSAKILGQK